MSSTRWCAKRRSWVTTEARIAKYEKAEEDPQPGSRHHSALQSQPHLRHQALRARHRSLPDPRPHLAALHLDPEPTTSKAWVDSPLPEMLTSRGVGDPDANRHHSGPATRERAVRTAYIIRRVLALIPTLLLIYTLTFFLMHATPGGPWDTSEKPIPADVQERLKRGLRLGQTALAAIHRFPQQSRARRSRPVLRPALANGVGHHRRNLPRLAAARCGRDVHCDSDRDSPGNLERCPSQRAARLSGDIHLDRRASRRQPMS